MVDVNDISALKRQYEESQKNLLMLKKLSTAGQYIPLRPTVATWIQL